MDRGICHLSGREVHIWNAISQCDSRELTARDAVPLAIWAVFR